jgi:hypothetical protein
MSGLIRSRAGLRDRVRDFIQRMIESELEAVLSRRGYARRPEADPENKGAGGSAFTRRCSVGSAGGKCRHVPITRAYGGCNQPAGLRALLSRLRSDAREPINFAFSDMTQG